MAVTLSVLLHKDSSEEAAKHRQGKHRKEGDQTDLPPAAEEPIASRALEPKCASQRSQPQPYQPWHVLCSIHRTKGKAKEEKL